MEIKNDKLLQSFADHIQAYPEIYIFIRKLAMDYARQGFRRIGTKHLVEVARHYYAKRGEMVEINNSFTSIYARMLVINKPELREYLEIRKAPKADKIPAAILDALIPKASAEGTQLSLLG